MRLKGGGGTKLSPTKSVVPPSRRRPAVYVELPAGKILILMHTVSAVRRQDPVLDTASADKGEYSMF